MGGFLSLDGGMLNLDGRMLNLNGGMRPPYNLSTEYNKRLTTKICTVEKIAMVTLKPLFECHLYYNATKKKN